jgi:hypothetical protein
MEGKREEAVRHISMIAALMVGGVVVAGALLSGNMLRGMWVGPLTGIAVWLVFRLGARLWHG